MDAIYNVKIKTPQGEQERKAIDLVALKDFIEDKKAEFSIFNLEFTKMDPDEMIWPYIGKAALSALFELESIVNEGLGLVKKDATSGDDQGPEEQQVIQTPPPQQRPQQAQSVRPRQAPPQRVMPTQEPEYEEADDGRVIL
jgi:hypothetical protein